MNDQPPNNKKQKKNPWLETRTIEEETNRDILSAVCFKYFSILIGAIFAILLAKPETVSGTSVFGFIPLRFTVYWYLLIGVFGLLGYEVLIMSARRMKSQIKIPFVFIALFGLYTIYGFFLFITLFGNLLGVNDNAG